jgi:hypothetical protein
MLGEIMVKKSICQKVALPTVHRNLGLHNCYCERKDKIDASVAYPES